MNDDNKKCKTCGGETKGYECAECGHKSDEHAAGKCDGCGSDQHQPKCVECSESEDNCTCPAPIEM